MLWSFLTVLCVDVVQMNCAPVSIEGDSEPVAGGGGRRVPGEGDTFTFLRRFGYLDQVGGGSNASMHETLYSEEVVVEAIRKMQHFGGIAETGKLDDVTKALLTKRRCGVPDILHEPSHGTRRGRFVLGSSGWNKRKLSYRLENWSPKLRPEDVHDDLSKAVKIWGDHSHLTFINKTDPRFDEVDILISFGRGYHGDRYPFDGAGGTLAHAFFPQNGPGVDGDIHFDSDEAWYHHDSTSPKESGRGGEGVSFLDVALHELGHSLGLAHSPSLDSVMFPYYQGPRDGSDPKLGHDDIMALYHLYISRSIDDGNEDEGSFPTRRTTPPATTTPTFPTSRHPSTTKPYPKTTTTKYDPSATTTSSTLPDLCDGEFDSISFMRNELFVFRGEYMWRWVERGQLAGGSYPSRSTRLFPFLHGVGRIDAAFERESDGNLIFISGDKYWSYDGVTSEGPLSISDFGLPEEGVDAAFVWGKNRMTYFFKGNQYWKQDETLNKNSGYPADIVERWRGIPSHLNSVITYKDGKTYFFKGREFWRFDDINIRAEDDFPVNTGRYWFNCASGE